MKSRISLYNRGIAKNYFRRFWVLWAVYLGALILALPMNAMYTLNNIANASFSYSVYTADRTVLNSGVMMVYLSAAASAVSVLAVFSFMYDKRSCNMINSMPVRRETAFSTAVICGLVPMLLADVIIFAVSAVLFAGNGHVEMSSLTAWLELCVMGNVAFFGIAVFSAMLTGNAWAMPLVYGIVNFAAAIAENEVQGLFSKLIYGYDYTAGKLSFLSPIVKLADKLYVSGGYVDIENYSDSGIKQACGVVGMEWCAVYCAAGIALTALSLLLYRRRSMECAGDTAAFKPLRPIFKYCMTFGTALLFALVLYENFFGGRVSDFASMAVLTALLLIGAFIGYFGAKMVLEKTMNVFRRDWSGFVVCACVVIVTAFACEFDMLGLETKIPDIDEVEYVSVSNDFYQKESIEQAETLHKKLIADKGKTERGTYYDNSNNLSVYFTYHLKDGKTLQRRYSIAENAKTVTDPDSAYTAYAALQNTEEGRRQRCTMSLPVSEESFVYCQIGYSFPGADGTESDFISLGMDKALELYACVSEDAENGLIGDYISEYSREYYERKTNVNIFFETAGRESGKYGRPHYGINYAVQVNSEKTLAWLAENTDIEVVPALETNPERYEELAEGTTADITIIGGADGPTAVFVTESGKPKI